MLKPSEFELVEIGETFGPRPLLVDGHWAKSFAYALDDYSPWWFAHSPFGGPIAMPWALAKEMLATFRLRYDPSGAAGLQQKNEVRYHQPVALGSTLALSAKFVEKYHKRGKGYTVLESQARNQAGTLLVSQRSTMIIELPKGVVPKPPTQEAAAQRVVTQWPEHLPPAARAHANLVAGTPIMSLVKDLRQGHMSIFSAVADHRINVHNNQEKARRAGFPDCVAQGAMSVCWLSEMLATFFGPEWLRSGWISVVFLHGIFPGERLTCRAVVTEVRDTDKGRELALDIWTENQDGSRATVGRATGLALDDRT